MEREPSATGVAVDHGCCPVYWKIPGEEVCLLGYAPPVDGYQER